MIFETCGVQTSRMNGPCNRAKGHGGSGKPWDPKSHRSAEGTNENTHKLTQFKIIVEVALDAGVRLNYTEIAILMGHPNVGSVARYGMGARYTRIRQRMYKERGIKPGSFDRRTSEQSFKLIADMRRTLAAMP